MWRNRATEVQQLNPVGPTKDRSSSPSQLNWKLCARAIIKSEAQPTGVQLKRSAKLLTVIGLTTKHAVYRITFMLYPILLKRMIIFLNWSEKSFRSSILLNLYTKSSIQVPIDKSRLPCIRHFFIFRHLILQPINTILQEVVYDICIPRIYARVRA